MATSRRRSDQRRLRELTDNWQAFGEDDPLWAILSHADKRGNRWDLDEFLETGEAEITEVLAEATGLVPSLAFGRALDFGCGVGRLTQALARRFATVDGVDIAAAMVSGSHATSNRSLTMVR